MRFDAIIFALIAMMSAASIQFTSGFFINNNEEKHQAVSKLSSIKGNLVTEVKEAIGDLKQATHLKVKGITGGIKAVGKAKFELLKGIKDAKIQLVKGIPSAKLAKIKAIKAGKLAIGKSIVAGLGKIFPRIKATNDYEQETGSRRLIDPVISSSSLKNFFPEKSQSIIINTSRKNSDIETILFKLFSQFFHNSAAGAAAAAPFRGDPTRTTATSDSFLILDDVDHSNSVSSGGDGGNIALFPTPISDNLPMTAHINIVTYKNQVLNPATSRVASFVPSYE